MTDVVDPNQHDRFVLRQRVKLVINQYEFSVPDAAGDGTPFCFVEQKRFAFKEDIRFFADATKGQELLRILARQRFDPRARYDIATAAGIKVGEIQKVFGRSLLRSTYTLYDAAGVEVTPGAPSANRSFSRSTTRPPSGIALIWSSESGAGVTG